MFFSNSIVSVIICRIKANYLWTIKTVHFLWIIFILYAGLIIFYLSYNFMIREHLQLTIGLD